MQKSAVRTPSIVTMGPFLVASRLAGAERRHIDSPRNLAD
jgi:hypothetical protein